ncbi:20686_t:CDS:2, partial [Racocetra persica]
FISFDSSESNNLDDNTSCSLSEFSNNKAIENDSVTNILENANEKSFRKNSTANTLETLHNSNNIANAANLIIISKVESILYNSKEKDIESIELELDALAVIYAMKYKEDNKVFSDHLTLHSLISNKVQTLFGIVERYERCYWLETWQLIELLHVIQYLAMILIKSELTANFLMSSTYEDYNNFLKSFLNNKNIFYKKPKFEASVIQKIIDLGIII